MIPFHTSIKVANLAALKNISSTTSPQRVDKGIYQVDDIGDNKPSLYLYRANFTNPEDIPSVIASNDNQGVFIQFFAGGTSGGGSGGGSGSGNIFIVGSALSLTQRTPETNPPRVNNGVYLVQNGQFESPNIYTYIEDYPYPEDYPYILMPNDGIGRYLMARGNVLFTLGANPPAEPPSYSSIIMGILNVHLRLIQGEYSSQVELYIGIANSSSTGINGWAVNRNFSLS
jgi:hypothetical protein